MIDSVIVIHVVQLTIAQEAQLGAAVAEIVMPIIHVTEASYAAIMWSWTHVGVVPLAMTQDTIVPLGAFLVDMISAILLALTTIKPPLALTPPLVEHMLVAPLLSYTSDGGVVNEGGTDSTTITPCCSSSVAVVGTVVVMSLVTSPYGMINMATMVSGS
jgi:hypothetical protein